MKEHKNILFIHMGGLFGVFLKTDLFFKIHFKHPANITLGNIMAENGKVNLEPGLH